METDRGRCRSRGKREGTPCATAPSFQAGHHGPNALAASWGDDGVRFTLRRFKLPVSSTKTLLKNDDYFNWMPSLRESPSLRYREPACFRCEPVSDKRPLLPIHSHLPQTNAVPP